MRILFAAYAEATQALPMVPLAWAARCDGHDVLVATQPELVDDLADSGLPVVSVGRGLPLYRLWRHAESEGDADGDLDLVDPEVPLRWPEARDAYSDLVQWWYRTANEPMIEDLVTLCREWRPDLVVWETVTFAGALAARAVGARHVRFLWSVDVLTRMRERVLDCRPSAEASDPLRDWLTGCARRVGIDYSEDLATGEATVTFLPASLRTADSAAVRYLPLRFVPYTSRCVIPEWLWDAPARRRVCVTFGTSALDRFGRFVVPVEEMLLGLADLDCEVVATLDPDDPTSPTGVPDNVRLVGRVPLEALLSSCDLAVSHAGPGTIATAMAQGVPQLLVPEEFDAPVLSRLLASTGAALELPPTASREAVREHASLLLSEGRFTRSARALQHEALSMPTPRDVVRQLERAATH